MKKSWAAAITSVTFLAACTQGPSNGPAPASSAGTSAPLTANGSAPLTINCGDGKQALVKQVTFGGQTASQIECVDVAQAPSQETPLLEDQPLRVVPAPAPAPAPVRTVVRERVVYRDRAPEPADEPVIVEEPAPVRTRPAAPAPVVKKRSGEKSALIIAGSTAAGAGAGAIVGGKKGAIIGAVVGGLGGTIYDRKTRTKQQ